MSKASTKWKEEAKIINKEYSLSKKTTLKAYREFRRMCNRDKKSLKRNGLENFNWSDLDEVDTYPYENEGDILELTCERTNQSYIKEPKGEE